MQLPAVGPKFNVDRTGVATESSDVQGSLRAYDVGLVVVTGRMRSTQIQPANGPGRGCESNVGGVPALVDWTVIVFSVKHLRPNRVRKLTRQPQHFVGDMNTHVNDQPPARVGRRGWVLVS